MKCNDCPYCWKEEEEEYARCHWVIRCPGDYPPCEEPEYEEEEDLRWEDYYCD